jgi:hypothetical protein
MTSTEGQACPKTRPVTTIERGFFLDFKRTIQKSVTFVAGNATFLIQIFTF